MKDRQSLRNDQLQLAYLCLQVTRQGQASYAHVHEIIDGLRSEGLDVRLYQPAFLEEKTSHPLMRAVSFMQTQARLWRTRPLPALVYIRAHVLAFPTALWARLFKIPVVQEVNGPEEDLYLAWPVMRPFAPVLMRIVRWQYRSADAVITVTGALADWVRSWVGHSEVHVVENGANTAVFHPEAARRETGLDSYVVFFGALSPWQGLEYLLSAVESSTWPKGTKLVVIGDGMCKEMVVDASRRNPAIVYLGRLPYEAVAGYVAAALASAVTKSDIGNRHATGLSPVKLYESVASGVPVIVTDILGQSDFVRTHGCGIVVPPGDSEAIAAAVALLQHDSALQDRLSRNARAIAHTVSWSERARRTHRVISSIVDREVD